MALWNKITSRGAVDDRRGSSIVPIGGGLGIVGFIAILLFNYIGGGDVGDVLNQLPTSQISTDQQVNSKDFEGADNYEVFVSTVLGSNNDMWEKVFAQANTTYREPKLVLFRNATQGSCGISSSAVGPHYCPADETIYLDETFFDELQKRFKAKGGDVAQAYVIAHEVGHHVQKQLGIMDKVQSEQSNNPSQANELSIKQELQADCFAGLWAHSIKDLGVFESDEEITEALDAAAAVGDDRIQSSTQGRVTPENWTHGSSEDRVKWFNTGYQTGSVSSCQTF